MVDSGFYCPKHIVLIGFSGAGKSTVARKLARKYGKVSFDTDVGIARMNNLSISDLFKQYGEEKFRELEYEYLQYLMSAESAIVSCGGGTISTQKNRELIRSMGFIVFMHVDPKEAVSRICRFDTRPLLTEGKSPEDLLAQRMKWYEELADLTFDTSGKGTSKVAYELGFELRERGLL